VGDEPEGSQPVRLSDLAETVLHASRVQPAVVEARGLGRVRQQSGRGPNDVRPVLQVITSNRVE